MRKKYLFLLLLGMLFVSCGKEIPEDIIQPAEMEELLYDYHLSISLGADLPNIATSEREALKNYALEKHNVSRALFDSSMVWYTRHANFLYEIYSQLDKRYTMAETRMKTQINKRSGQIEISLSGDSVDVWSDRDIYWLSTSRLTNKVTFNLKADTTFRPMDALALEAKFTFFSPDSISTTKAIVGLNFNLKNDSIHSLVQSVTTSGSNRFYLKSTTDCGFERITGFIYCVAPDSVQGNVLVSGIRLMRYHDKGEEAPLSEDADKSDEDRADGKNVDVTKEAANKAVVSENENNVGKRNSSSDKSRSKRLLQVESR